MSIEKGIGKPMKNRDGVEVVSITLDAQGLKAYADYALASGNNRVTVDVALHSFVCGPKSKIPGQARNKYEFRSWLATPKA